MKSPDETVDNRQPADHHEVLRKLAALSIETWNYKTDDPSIRHIGPMAQDFAAAFNVGHDDKHIHVVDSMGVAFAAIKALHEVLQERAAGIEAMKAELRALKADLAALRQTQGDTPAS